LAITRTYRKLATRDIQLADQPKHAAGILTSLNLKKFLAETSWMIWRM